MIKVKIDAFLNNDVQQRCKISHWVGVRKKNNKP